MRTSRSAGSDWDYWWEEFKHLAAESNLNIDEGHPESYRDYHEDGDTPSHAVEVELSYMDQ